MAQDGITTNPEESLEEPTDQTIYDKARTARDKLNTILTDLGHKADDAGHAVKKGLSQAEASMKEGIDVTGQTIREYPFAAVGIAAGIGLIVGLLINRHR